MLIELLFEVVTYMFDWIRVWTLRWLLNDFILLLFEPIPSQTRGILRVIVVLEYNISLFHAVCLKKKWQALTKNFDILIFLHLAPDCLYISNAISVYTALEHNIFSKICYANIIVCSFSSLLAVSPFNSGSIVSKPIYLILVWPHKSFPVVFNPFFGVGSTCKSLLLMSGKKNRLFLLINLFKTCLFHGFTGSSGLKGFSGIL